MLLIHQCLAEPGGVVMNVVRPLDASAQQLHASIGIYTADDWADLVAPPLHWSSIHKI
jgi:hypothetical protein